MADASIRVPGGASQSVGVRSDVQEVEDLQPQRAELWFENLDRLVLARQMVTHRTPLTISRILEALGDRQLRSPG